MLKLKAWLSRRREFLMVHPACEDHLQLGLRLMATEVHHLVRRERPEESTDDELLALCHEHHALRTRAGA